MLQYDNGCLQCSWSAGPESALVICLHILYIGLQLAFIVMVGMIQISLHSDGWYMYDSNVTYFAKADQLTTKICTLSFLQQIEPCLQE